MRLRLTRSADRDIVAILLESRRVFDDRQAVRYARIIESGIALLLENPYRPASKNSNDLGEGVRCMHLQFAAKRRGGASHFIYYRIDRHVENADELVVLRVLGDRMEPYRRVALALRAEQNAR